MNIAVIQYLQERNNEPPLAGQMAEQYELRIVDEDDSDMEIDTDLPALGRDKLIADLNLSFVGMCFKGKSVRRSSRKYIIGRESDIKSSDVTDVRRLHIDSGGGRHILNTGNTIDYLRVTIPGVSDTKLTLDLSKEKDYTLNSLFPMINKKRQENLVNSEFFCFYYLEDGKLFGGALSNRMSAQHLTKDELVLLPSEAICDKIHQEGFNFNSQTSEVDELTLLSIQRPKEFKVWKLGDRGKRKVRKFSIGRYLIRKTIDDNSLLKKDHYAIEIGKIIRCNRSSSGKRGFNLIYNHITGNQDREQEYEAVSEEQCTEIVNKINFFRKLSQYYGSEDVGGEVLKARKARALTLIRRKHAH